MSSKQLPIPILTASITRERKQQNYWFKVVPESHMLSDADIARFVKILLPCVKNTMYSHTANFQKDYQCLIKLAPDIVLPDLLDG